ncbi:hypothetical protein CDAR_494301 [Caerostris darwini]|nr:hypothetical protein CDAR_494301 [Caerostris darwini]
MVAVSKETDEAKKNSSFVGNQLDVKISIEDYKQVYSLAKNISHSKGPIIMSKEGDLEYRRSLVRKISLKTRSEVLKKLVKNIQKFSNYSVLALQELEYLVHEYETAVDFVKLGGLELVLPLVNHEDSRIASGALSILTAAVQGNPIVQQYAEKAHILDYIIRALTGKPHNAVTSVLFTLSSYLRNNAVSQLKFFRSNGLHILANILQSPEETMKSKIKIIDLLNDIAVEIYSEPEDINEDKILQIRRLFADGVQKENICEKLPRFLNYNDLAIQGKTANAMNSLNEICVKKFNQKNVMESIKRLIDIYNPYTKKYWYSKDDMELNWLIWNDLETLYRKMKFSKRTIKTEL